MKIDIQRLSDELKTLSRFSDAEPPAVTRILYTEADTKARTWLKSLCEQAGLKVREDAIGNLFARWEGSDPSLPAVGTGSHTDAIPHSGKYDGTLGVLGGLEAIRSLQSAGVKPKRSIELLMFTSEEPTRFGLGCVGSRTLTGAWTPEAIAALKDKDGQTLEQVRQSAGFSGPISSVRLPSDYYSHFVELHIEQGPLLEKENIPIGVVTAIAAPAAMRMTLNGEGGHAGGVLMPDRRDALCAAAEIVLAVEAAAKSSGSPDAVGTTGVCKVHPGAINSIPSQVSLEIDVRDIDLEARDRSVAAIRRAADDVSKQRGVKIEVAVLNADPPATMAASIVAAVENACRALGLPYKKMPSRAYHDSLYMARICPTGMIFIPCRSGVSHRPDEYSSPEQMQRGVQVLAGTLRELAG